MPPVIHCVRHAQGVHNLSHANHNILDPCLTDLGEKQSLDIANNYSGVFDDASLVLASPLRRTISTALLAFKTILGSYGKVLAWPAIQEASDLPCDTGSDVTELQAEFDSSSVDLTLVEPGWQIKVRTAADGGQPPTHLSSSCLLFFLRVNLPTIANPTLKNRVVNTHQTRVLFLKGPTMPVIGLQSDRRRRLSLYRMDASYIS